MTITTAAAAELGAAITEQQVVGKIAWRLMPLIIVCYFFAFFDRVNISFAKASLQADLGLSNTAYGFGASLFVVGYVLLEVPSNMLLYRFGARRWIARIMISWGLATAAMVFVRTEWQFYALRLIIGAPISGLILNYTHGLHGLAGWQWLFLAGGLPCVGLGLIVLLRFDDSI